MKIDAYNHFVCVVAGDFPQKLMSKYDKNLEVSPYIVWKREDAETIRQKLVNTYKAVLSTTLDGYDKNALIETIKYTETADALDIFDDFTIGYDIDPKTGDAMSTENPDGKWESYQIGKLFSVPFINLEGREVFQETKGNVDWERIHGSGKEIYAKAWEMVMEGKKPENDTEKSIYENMKERKAYFDKFGNKDVYVMSNTAFWGLAFLSEETGWVELPEDMDQFKWMSEYFDRFIKGLPDDTKLTILECRR